MQTPFGKVRFFRIVRVDAGRRIVADQATIAAALETVERPVGQLVACGGFAEIDLAVGRDVEVVSQIETGIVLETGAGPVGAVRHLEDGAIRLDAVNPHARDTDKQVLLAVESKAERPAADAGEFFAYRIVGRPEANDRAVAVDGVEVVLAVENDVLRSLDLVERDGFGVAQTVVFGEHRAAVARDRRRRLEVDPARHDVDLLQHLALVLDPFDVEADGDEKNDADDRGRESFRRRRSAPGR